jgi:hypothetical protein
MEDKMNIVQLRATIFLQQNIGYTQENAERFKTLLMPNARILGVTQPGIPVYGVNPYVPQYGMPWRLFDKQDGGMEYNIMFLPGKIDIILAKEAPYCETMEAEFCNKSTEWFGKILNAEGISYVTRVAYAPLYAFDYEECNGNGDFWRNILVNKSVDGIQMQDINVSYLLKTIERVGTDDVQLNMLHSIFDGVVTRKSGDKIEEKKVILFQLDLNTVPEKLLNYNGTDIERFFKKMIDIKNKLVSNVAKS